MIFVVALSITIFLFSSLMNYSEEAYDYMHMSSNGAVLVNVPVNRHLILNGQDVISYYYNYVKKDRYSDSTYNSNTVVNINLNTKNESPVILTSDTITYKELLEKISLTDKYILTVDESSNSQITYINIIKATEEELQEMW